MVYEHNGMVYEHNGLVYEHNGLVDEHKPPRPWPHVVSMFTDDYAPVVMVRLDSR